MTTEAEKRWREKVIKEKRGGKRNNIGEEKEGIEKNNKIKER